MTQTPFKHLPQRLSRAVDREIDAQRIERSWQGTRDRMRTRRVIARTTALASVAALVMIAVFASRSSTGADQLRLSDGEILTQELESPAEAGIELVFEDRSRISLDPGTVLVPVANDRGRMEFTLSKGETHVSVTPGGNRRWRLVAGQTTIEVIGTEFSVHRTVEGAGERVEVIVSHGRVRVRDARLPNGERVLSDGESVAFERDSVVEAVESPAPSEAGGIAEPSEPSFPPEPEEPEPEEVEEAPQRFAAPKAMHDVSSLEEETAAPPDWDALATEGNHDAAYAELGTQGIDREAEHADPAHLMLLADVARLSGHPEDAVAPLSILIEEHPEDSRAAFAAVTLGRLEMDRLHHPDRARHAFELALTLGLPSALMADVERRLSRLPVESAP